MEVIKHGDEIVAIIVHSADTTTGVSFYTPDSFSQQLALMAHPVGKVIQPHVHNRIERTVEYTQEVLFIRKGTMRVDLFSKDDSYLGERTLREGDVILLASGGHGFEMLEPTELIEVKQGPYAGVEDKRYLSGESRT